MNYYIKDLKDLILPLGRTFSYLDPATGEEALFFDWTMSGVRFTCTAAKAEARIRGIGLEMLGVKEQPYIAVRLDDADTLKERIGLADGEQWVTLFEAASAQRHTVEILKMSENARGKAALLEIRLTGDDPEDREHSGHIEKAADDVDWIEFIGDSITCGYGNEAPDKDAPFLPQEENGFISFASLTARHLGLRPQLVSVSGIGVAVDRSHPMPFKIPAMEELYPYTDRLTEEHLLGRDLADDEAKPWDFAGRRPKIVVLNLGTNDVNSYKMTRDLPKAKAFFHEHYRKFIETIRRLNGPEAMIYCVLGPLDYYLYDEIRDIVEAYANDTGDTKIETYKFIPVLQWSEGFGAVGHPSAKTHERMAMELAAKIRSTLR